MGPVREYHTSAFLFLPDDFTQKLDPLIWNVIVPINATLAREVALNNSFTVKALWTEAIHREGTAPNCSQTRDPIPLNDYRDYGIVFLQFLCPSRSYNNLPDLAITVNFRALSGVIASNADFYHQPAIPISIGMTNSSGIRSVKDIFERSPPVSLIPGTNIAAPYTLRARQVFTHHALAALGIFQKTRAFAEPEFLGFYPDPNVDTSLRDAQIATLRLYSAQDWSNFEVFIDRRMNESVIAGLANVGGLWTALNGIFALIFGASMLHILYGGKILRIFGLAHSFDHRKMRDEALRLYPNIVKEHSDISRRGLLSLLKDHLIDLSFLEKETSYSERPVKGAGDLEIPAQAEGLAIPLVLLSSEAQQGLTTSEHRSEYSTTEKVASGLDSVAELIPNGPIHTFDPRGTTQSE